MNKRVAATTGLALLLGGLLAFAFYPGAYPPYNEGRDYVAIAAHRYAQVTSFYGARILHPLFVRLLAGVFHAPINAQLFLRVSVGGLLALFVLFAVWYATENLRAPSLCLLLIATPVVIDSYRNYYWHDLFYAALCALFFLLLRRSLWLALPLLFLLYLTRESTVVLVIALLGLAALRRQWTFCLSVLLVAIAGAKIPPAVIGHAFSNNQGISSAFVYDALKVPYNFFYNVCGLEFWTNTDAATLLPPIWHVALPAWLHVGRIREVGYSGFFWTRPAHTLLILSASFGIFPLVAARGGIRDGIKATHRRFDLAAAFWYGALMFILTPLIGTQPGRYVIYAWPVFWLFGVELLNVRYADAKVRSRIIFWSLLAAWTPAIIRLLSKPPVAGPESLYDLSTGGLILSLVLVAAIYFRAWRLINSAEPLAD